MAIGKCIDTTITYALNTALQKHIQYLYEKQKWQEKSYL